MASSLSEEEFQRLQTQFIELRSANYSLEEKCRKQYLENELCQEKYDVLNREFQKAQKVIAKSKKIKDVELLLQENESLQLKLQSQEDEFQLQNATILQELSTLVSANEKLERELETNKTGENLSSSSPGQGNGELRRLQDDNRKFQAETLALQKTLAELKTKHEDEIKVLRESLRKLTSMNAVSGDQIDCCNTALTLDTDRCLQSEEADSGIIQVGEKEVSFHKINNSSMVELFQQNEDRMQILEKRLEEYEGMKLELCTVKEEKQLLKEQMATLQSSTEIQSSNLQDEVNRLTEKLKKKQESLVHLQAEKESLYNENKKSYEELQTAKEQELQLLKEQIQRLQTQINNNLQNFQEYRENSSSTIDGLENEVKSLKNEVNQQSAERVRELENNQEASLAELSEMRITLQTTTDDMKNVMAQLDESVASVEKLTEEVKELEKVKLDITSSLTEMKKVAEKRKTLLDDMAIHLQKKSDEYQQEMAKLSEEFTLKLSQITEELEEEKIKAAKIDELKSQIDDLETEIKSLECTKGWFERRLSEAEEALENTKKYYESAAKQKDEKNQSHLDEVKADCESRIKDLETQLEISNVQKSEYEECISKLSQELKDGLEERKIHDKKGTSIVKDLKRQLQVERKRAERLQERLQELLSDSTATRSVEVSSFRPPTDAGDRADTSSISSWSLMSGGQLDSTRDTQDESGTGSSNHNGNSPTPSNMFEQEYNDLLSRITALQQENWILDEKVNHLEESNGAMAEDLVHKQALIQYYCMEGRQDPHQHNPHFDKLTVKRVVDFIKDKGDANQQEINRKLLRSLEETLTKNMCLQKDLESLSQEMVKLKLAVDSDGLIATEITSSTLQDVEQEQ